jgi:hypothetical protein
MGPMREREEPPRVLAGPAARAAAAPPRADLGRLLPPSPSRRETPQPVGAGLDVHPS